MPRGGPPADVAVDVAVIGAGFSGLRAGLDLAGAGLDVTVLEARHRVGGRAFTEVTPSGAVVDHGGQWMGPTQDALAALAAACGVATFPTYARGDSVEIRGGRRHDFQGLVPTSDPDGGAEAVAALLDFDLRAQEIPPDVPWTHPDALDLDDRTLAGWVEATTGSVTARRLLETATLAVFGCEPSELSLLYALAYAHGGGSLSALVRTTGGAQERRFAGGAQQLARHLAGGLGDRVVLDAPVVAVAHEADGAVVTTAGDAGGGPPRRFSARRVVVAMPPAVQGRIAFDPPLPGRRHQLSQRSPMGSVTKVHAVYDRPFWRDAGLNGQLVADAGALRTTFDDSPEDGSHGVLAGFIAGRADRRLEEVGREGRRRIALQELEVAFGGGAAAPVEFVEQRWSADPFTGGGPVACLGPGVLTGCGPALREPVGVVHWAGTETAERWSGYLDGALTAGARAAAEVVDALGRGEDVATADEIVEAFAEWRTRCNANPRVAAMVRGWDRTVHLVASDTGDEFTVTLTDTVLAELTMGRTGLADLVVTATSEDFADLFWGDLNPSEKYVSGEITLAGSSQDVLRLDALSMVVFLDQ